ncbi:MFS transporter [Alkalihalobacillus sp. 1P02AB]|uniref:MFS transporter n=1 Tax=Alkalihalobacillus sp. 1P02AB TaxID=3132260 RepID=UPI0039A4F602
MSSLIIKSNTNSNGASISFSKRYTFISFILTILTSTKFTIIKSIIIQKPYLRYNFLINPFFLNHIFTTTPTDAILLFISAIVTFILPNVEVNIEKAEVEKFNLETIRNDWKTVISFSKQKNKVMFIYFIFTLFIVLQTAIDSLEVAFAQGEIGLNDGQYGVLVSIAGVGLLIGALLNSLFTKRLTVRFLIGISPIFVSSGYLIFSFSTTFLGACVGVCLLGFASAFANTGFITFYQANIPVDMLGRIASLYRFLEALLILTLTVVFAFGAEFISTRHTVISGSLITLLLMVLLANFVYSRKQNQVIWGS